MLSNTKPKVTFVHRKARAVGNYSLEFIFQDVRKRLLHQIDSYVFHSKYESNGVFKRLYNVFQLFFERKKIVHITGDVNYLGLLLNPNKTIHTILDCVQLTSTTGIKHTILKFFWLTVPVKKSKYITAISTSTKNEILKYAPCNPNKIVVIPVAISTQFKASPKIFNTQKPTILQLGTAHNKNIEALLEAVKDIPCIIDIVGAHQQHLVDYMEAHNMEYTYSQGLTNNQIIQKYINADIVSLISTYEGFGMPILEGQATGRVVITANTYSMPEVGGNAAHYVTPTNIAEIKMGIQKIISDATYREQLITNGYENVKRFDAQTIAEQYYKLYQTISL